MITVENYKQLCKVINELMQVQTRIHTVYQSRMNIRKKIPRVIYREREKIIAFNILNPNGVSMILHLFDDHIKRMKEYQLIEFNVRDDYNLVNCYCIILSIHTLKNPSRLFSIILRSILESEGISQECFNVLIEEAIVREKTLSLAANNEDNNIEAANEDDGEAA